MFGPLPAVLRVIFQRIGLLMATGDERDAEILALRHQVLVLQRQVTRPRFTNTDRTILAVYLPRTHHSVLTRDGATPQGSLGPTTKVRLDEREHPQANPQQLAVANNVVGSEDPWGRS